MPNSITACERLSAAASAVSVEEFFRNWNTAHLIRDAGEIMGRTVKLQVSSSPNDVLIKEDNNALTLFSVRGRIASQINADLKDASGQPARGASLAGAIRN